MHFWVSPNMIGISTLISKKGQDFILKQVKKNFLEINTYANKEIRGDCLYTTLHDNKLKQNFTQLLLRVKICHFWELIIVVRYAAELPR